MFHDLVAAALSDSQDRSDRLRPLDVGEVETLDVVRHLGLLRPTYPRLRPSDRSRHVADSGLAVSDRIERKIRAGYAAGKSKRGLARELGISDGAVRRVLAEHA